MYRILSKVVESKILQAITAPSHAEPSISVERESYIGLPISQQEKWETGRSISKYGQLFPGTGMGTYRGTHEVLRPPTSMTKAEYAIILDTTHSMTWHSYKEPLTSTSKFVAGFLIWLILKEAKIHGDMVSLYLDNSSTGAGMGNYSFSDTMDPFSLSGYKEEDGEKKRIPSTYDYDAVWEFYINSGNEGGGALTITPYYQLMIDANKRPKASPLNLIIMGDFDNLGEESAKNISIFLDYYKKKYGEINASVITIDGSSDESKFKDVQILSEIPIEKGGLGATYIHLPYGNKVAINPQDVARRIEAVAFRPNSPLRKYGFKTRI